MQSLEQQVWIKLDLMMAMGKDELTDTTSGNHGKWLLLVFFYTVDETVDHRCIAIDDATLHAFHGVATDEMLGSLDGNMRKLRGFLTERGERGTSTWDDHATDMMSSFVDDADGGGCTHIDNHQREVVLMDGSYCVGNPISAKGLRLVDVGLQTRSHALLTYDEHFMADEHLGCLC